MNEEIVKQVKKRGRPCKYSSKDELHQARLEQNRISARKWYAKHKEYVKRMKQLEEAIKQISN